MPEAKREAKSDSHSSGCLNQENFSVSPRWNAIGIMKYLIPWPTTEAQSVDSNIESCDRDAYFLLWPPNLFAWTSMFLKASGAYARVTEADWPDSEGWTDAINELMGSNVVCMNGKVPFASVKDQDFRDEILEDSVENRLAAHEKFQFLFPEDEKYEEALLDVILPVGETLSMIPDAPSRGKQKSKKKEVGKSKEEIEKENNSRMLRIQNLISGNRQYSVSWQDLVSRSAFAWKTMINSYFARRLNGISPFEIVRMGKDEFREAFEGIKNFEIHVDDNGKPSCLKFKSKFIKKMEYPWGRAISDIPVVIRRLWVDLRSAMKMAGDGKGIDEIWDADNLAPYSRASRTSRRLTMAIQTLHAIADATCLGWGLGDYKSGKENEDGVLEEFTHSSENYAGAIAMGLLRHYGTLATIDSSRARILPKRHTPGIGVTLRSVSSSMCFHRSSVDVKWITNGPNLTEIDESVPESTSKPQRRSLSLLLLPWPLEVHARDFRPSNWNWSEQGGDRRFKYDPDVGLPIRDELKHILSEVDRETQAQVDLAILPECAASYSELDDLQYFFQQEGVRAFVTGVRNRPPNQNRGGNIVSEKNTLVFPGPKVIDWDKSLNSLCFGWPEEVARRNGLFQRHFQDKHHPWFLNSWQIKSYQLGGQLHPNERWREDIPIGRRRVSMINFGSKLTICPLICEDLARQDPIAELIRAVGPSLVIALLMDGPQIQNRWAARYANVLADDPGSSVITLSSLGMVNRHDVGQPKRRVVGLWSDRKGEMKEITLEDGAIAVLLSLAIEDEKFATMDNRKEPTPTFTLSFGGIHQIYGRNK